MRIDFHSHYIPASAIASSSTGEPWHGVEFGRTESGALFGSSGGVTFDLPEWSAGPGDVTSRLKTLNSLGLDSQVLSIAPRLQRYTADSRQAVALARDMNDDLQDLALAAPDRIYGLIHLPLQDQASSISELKRMAGRPGIVGAAVGTNVAGAPWDTPEFFPILAAAQDLGMLVFFHPANRPADPRMKKHHLKNLVGNPLETTLAIASLIFGGVFDRLTTLQTCFAHAGGFAPTGIGRFDAGYRARMDVRQGVENLPSSYLRRIYFDSITFSETGLRHLIDVAGISQIVLGSDYPADMGTPDPVGFIESCKSLTREEKDAILGANASRLVAAAARPATEHQEKNQGEEKV